jgi:hypothetical protein
VATENLPAAVKDFNRAASLAQAREAVVAEGLATVGLARVMLRRELFTEAATTLQDTLVRFRNADEPDAQARAYSGIGEARRNLGEVEAARSAFARAAQFASRAADALGEAEALRGEGRTLLDVPELEAATGRFAQAMGIVARVGLTITGEEVRATFFATWAGLYAEAIYTAAREQSAERAQALASDYANRASREGAARAGQRLREFEQSLPTRGADLTKEDIERNKATAKVLAEARKALTKR